MLEQQLENRLRIAFLTQLDPLDKRSWSGSLYYMRQALQQHCGDVSCIGPLQTHKPSLASKIRAKSSRLLFKKRYLHETSITAARQCGIEATRILSGQMFDVIVAAAGGIETMFLETNVPIVLVGDATFAQLLGYLPYYTGLSERSIREIKTIEEQAFKKVRAVAMSSEWAAQAAIQEYHVDSEHVYYVPFGANLETMPSRKCAETKMPSSTCRLLFSGVEWQRKGGDIAIETLLKLEELGIEAELTICGCEPPAGFTHPRMTIKAFLDKNDERQAREIEKIYTMSDFLILPTRADCAPNVFKEANAYGIPVITTETGGVASIIHNGENGYMLPISARGSDYAHLIAAIYHDKQHYLRLVESSRKAFEAYLNWDAWGHRLHEILLHEITMKDHIRIG